MKVTGILFFVVVALVAVSTAQTLTAKGNPSDLQVVKMSWKRDSRPAREAYPKDKKPTDEQLHGKDVPPTQSTRAERTQPTVYDNATRPGQEVEELWPATGPLVSGYLYQITVRNTGPKEIKTINWQYIFTDSHDPNIVMRHQFLSRTKISPGKEAKLSKFTIAAPTRVVNAKNIASNSKQSYLEQVLITRIEYLDGSVWERPTE